MAANWIFFCLVAVPFVVGVIATRRRSVRERQCPHELVETGKSGAGSVYRCRLCGAVLYDKGATKEIPLPWNWIFTLGFLGMSLIGLVGEVFPAVIEGKLQHHSVVGRDTSPGTYWFFIVLFSSFSAATLAASIGNLWSAFRKMKGRHHGA